MPTKSANNALELGFINYIPANNTLNFTATPVSGGNPIADASAGNYANAAFDKANSAFASANNVAPQIQPAFNRANAAFAAANSAFAAANSVNVYGANTSSNSFIALPQGTTSDRPNNPQLGSLRYNTTNNYFEAYTTNGWLAFLGLTPSILSVTPSTFSGNTGTPFTISGSGFMPDAVVKFVSSNGAEYTAGSVVYANSYFLQATTPKIFTVAEEPLGVKIYQNQGLSFSTFLNAIDCGGVPIWNTASGALSTTYDRITYTSANTIYNLNAYDPDGNGITYSISSGSLPTGSSLGSSNGKILGPISDVASNTTFNFDITAFDGINSTTRSFNILVTRALDGSTSARAAPNASYLMTTFGFTTNGLYWLNLGNGVGPLQVYCVLDSSVSGGGWMIWYGTPSGATSGTYRVSSLREDRSTNPLTSNYSLSYTQRSGLTAISTQSKSIIGIHGTSQWLRVDGLIWNSTIHNDGTGNYNFENSYSTTSSNGGTDNSVRFGLINYNNSGGGDFGLGVDSLDHHSGNYYHLNSSCVGSYIYNYGSGYKTYSAYSGFVAGGDGCSDSATNSFGFYIGSR